MQTTTNIGLRKPNDDDFINIEDLNHNAEVLDEKVQEALDGIGILEKLKGNIALTTDQEFVNSLLDNTAKAGSLLLFFYAGHKYGNVTGEDYDLYTGLNNCITYSGCGIMIQIPDGQGLQEVHPQYFQYPSFYLVKISESNPKTAVIFPFGTNDLWVDVESAKQRADEAFRSASSGKTEIAAAITGKGVAASSADTFPTLANKITQIRQGRGNAQPADVLIGQTFSNDQGDQRGTMPNLGNWSLGMSASGYVTIPRGFHRGGGQVTAQMASGRTILPGTSQQTAIGAGQMARGNIIVTGDVNLNAGNIKDGASIFGVRGTYGREEKALIANTLTGLGTPTSTTASWQTIADNMKLHKYKQGSLLNMGEVEKRDIGKVDHNTIPFSPAESPYTGTLLMEKDDNIYQLKVTGTDGSENVVIKLYKKGKYTSGNYTLVTSHTFNGESMVSSSRVNNEAYGCNEGEGCFLVSYVQHRTYRLRIIKINTLGGNVLNWTGDFLNSSSKVYTYPHNGTVVVLSGQKVIRYVITGNSVNKVSEFIVPSHYPEILPTHHYIFAFPENIPDDANARVCTIYRHDGTIHQEYFNHNFAGGYSNFRSTGNKFLIAPVYVLAWNAVIIGYSVRDSSWRAVDRFFWINPDAKTSGVHSDFIPVDYRPEEGYPFYWSYGPNMLVLSNKTRYSSDKTLGRLWVSWIPKLRAGAYIEFNKTNNIFSELQEDWHKNDFLRVWGYIPFNSPTNEGELFVLGSGGAYNWSYGRVYRIAQSIKIK